MSSGATQFAFHTEPSEDRLGGESTDIDSQTIFTALEDPDCRTLLEAASDEAMTAQELTAQCDIPRSTTYRKVELLTESGLLEEQVRLRPDGKHASEYRRAFEEFVVTLSDSNALEVDVSRAPAGD